MGNTILPFDELMKAVLEQLKSQKYMDSTLIVYRRTYNRIHIFLNHHGTDVYTHELGKSFTEPCILHLILLRNNLCPTHNPIIRAGKAQ